MMPMKSTTKDLADDAALRKDWNAAKDLYLQALSENTASSPELSTKTHANLSMVYLQLSEFDKAIHHARLATELDPLFGKAHARLAKALEASGRLLEANEAYSMASSLGFTGFGKAHENLKKNWQYRKLALIQKAQAKEEVIITNRVGERIELPPPESDPAILAMNEEQRGILRMIEKEGRVLPSSLTSVETLKEQDLILYLAAVDASMVLEDFGGRCPLVCPGTRQWILYNYRRDFEEGTSRHFDIYHDLFHIHDESICLDEYDKGWIVVENEERKTCYTILLSPNRYCDKDMPEAPKWGPTVMFETRESRREWLGDSRVLYRGVFLMGLRHWVLVQCQSMGEFGQGFGILPNGAIYNGAIEWNASEQKLVDIHKRYSLDPSSFYKTADDVLRYFATSSYRPEEVPDELYYYKEGRFCKARKGKPSS